MGNREAARKLIEKATQELGVSSLDFEEFKEEVTKKIEELKEEIEALKKAKEEPPLEVTSTPKKGSKKK